MLRIFGKKDWRRGEAPIPFDAREQEAIQRAFVEFRLLANELAVRSDSADELSALLTCRALFDLGHEDLARKRARRAEDAFLKALAVYPPAYGALFYLAVALNEQGRRPEANKAAAEFIEHYREWTSGGGSPRIQVGRDCEGILASY